MKRTALLLTTAVVGYFAPTQNASAQSPGPNRNTVAVNEDGGYVSRPRPQPSPPARIVPPTPPKPIVTPSPVAGRTAPPRQHISPLPTGPTSIPSIRTPTRAVTLAGTQSSTPSARPYRPMSWATDYRLPPTPRVADALSRTVHVTFRDRARGILLTVVTRERDVPAALARYRDWEYVATTALPNR